MKDVQRALLDHYCTALHEYSVAVRNFAASLQVGDELAIKSARRAVIASRMKCVKALGTLDGRMPGMRMREETPPHLLTRPITARLNAIGLSASE
jgi:hypothetical protein